MTDTNNLDHDLADAKLSVWSSFRTTREEKDELIEHAHMARISLSQLVRRRALRKAPPRAAVPALNVRLYGEFGKTDNNLNQLAKAANQSGQFGPTQLPAVLKVFQEHRDLIAEFRAQLIGTDQEGEDDE